MSPIKAVLEKDDYQNSTIARQGLQSQDRFRTDLLKQPAKIEWFGTVQDIQEADRKQQSKGIDYILITTSGTITVDIKMDSYLGKTDNLLMETKTFYNGIPKDGWGFYSQCDYIVYHAPAVKKYYIIKLNDILKAYAQYCIDTNFNPKQSLDGRVMGKAMLNSLIPSRYWIHYTQIVDVE